MEKRETLRQYLTYNKDTSNIEKIFIDLDNQLKYIHSQGFCVSELNSDSIIMEESYNSSYMGLPKFSFSSISRFGDVAKDVSNNITDLSKLAIGAYISVENGFCDYSQLSTNYIKQYFNEILFYLPNASYFKGVMIDNDISYYNDYIQMNSGNSKSDSRQKSYTNAYGKMYTPDDDAAFIQLVFYPVIIISVITVIAVLSKMMG